jgi:hypothetical protein
MIIRDWYGYDKGRIDGFGSRERPQGEMVC